MALIDFILNFEDHLTLIIENYGVWVYVILFLIIFAETGLVITPFLPGDSLLFVAGTFASLGSLNAQLLVALLVIAAIVGDTVNYWIGSIIGPRIFRKENVRFLNKEHLVSAEEFYKKHGAFTIIMARFMPIIRTFAPFVAGIGKMHYGHFLLFNVIGGIMWVMIFVLGGYFFGTIPVVKENLTTYMLAIIGISLIPVAIPYLRRIIKKRKNR